jgi:exosortase
VECSGRKPAGGFGVEISRVLRECASVLPNSERLRSAPWLIIASASAIAVIVAVLFGFVSYSAGYNELRVPVFTFARNMWKLEDWQHCMLVPIAAAGIIYFQRKRLATLPVRGSWIGLVPVLAALWIFWFGYQADIVYFGYISAQILIAGLIILFFGWGWMKALAFSWMFLAFMWPLLFLGDNIAFPLRVVMSKASVFTLNLLGVDSTLSGTAILSAADPLTRRPMGDLFSVDVADPCSGIRSLFALMMVSALYGQFAVQGFWKKWIIFLSSMPLAVLGNLGRILMLTFGTIILGPGVAIGTEDHPSFFHMLSGYVVFAVAIMGMIGLAKFLNIDWSGLRDRFNRPPAPPAARGRAGSGTPQGKVQDVY